MKYIYNWIELGEELTPIRKTSLVSKQQQQNCFNKNDMRILKSFLTVIPRKRCVFISRFEKQRLILVSCKCIFLKKTPTFLSIITIETMGWVSPIFYLMLVYPMETREGGGGELIYKGRSFYIFISYGLLPN